MEIGDHQPEERAVRCPYLDGAEGRPPICLSRPGDRLVIGSRYVETYCLTAEHVRCTLFRHAKAASEPEAPRAEPNDRAEAVAGRGRADETLVIPTIRRGDAAAKEPPAQIGEQVPPHQPARAAPTITSPVHQATLHTDTVTIVGTADAGSEIALFDWQQPVGRTVADQHGHWSICLTGVMPGGHVYAARTLEPESGALSPISPLCAIEVEAPAPSPQEPGDRSARGRRPFPRLGSQLAGRVVHRARVGVPASEPAVAGERSPGVTTAGPPIPAKPPPDLSPAMPLEEEAIDPVASVQTWPEHELRDGAGAMAPSAEPVRHTTSPRQPEPAPMVDRVMLQQTVAAEPVGITAEERGPQRVSDALTEPVEAEVIAAEPVAAETMPVEVVATKVEEADDVHDPFLRTDYGAELVVSTVELDPVPQDDVHPQAAELVGPEPRDMAAATQALPIPSPRHEAMEAPPKPQLARESADREASPGPDGVPPAVLRESRDGGLPLHLPVAARQEAAVGKRPIGLVLGIVGAAMLIALIALALFLMHRSTPHAAIRSHRVSHPPAVSRSHPVPHPPAVSRRHPAPPAAAPAPATLWTFPPVRASADEVMLILSNANRFPVRVRVHLAGRGSSSTQRARIPASNGAEMPLTPGAMDSTVTVHASAPILVQRFVTRKGVVRSVPGIRGAASGKGNP